MVHASRAHRNIGLKAVQQCVTAQSICWLYCWAKTGMNSANAAQQSRQAFNQIFDRPYEWFDARVPHEWARVARYRTVDIESDLIQWFTDYKSGGLTNKNLISS